MSSQYKNGADVPTDVLCDRLDELAQVVTRGTVAVGQEFTMRIPAEHDRDADLVLSEAARRLRQFEARDEAWKQSMEAPGEIK